MRSVMFAALWLSIATIVAMCLYPPWETDDDVGRWVPAGYHWVWSPPESQRVWNCFPSPAGYQWVCGSRWRDDLPQVTRRDPVRVDVTGLCVQAAGPGLVALGAVVTLSLTGRRRKDAAPMPPGGA